MLLLVLLVGFALYPTPNAQSEPIHNVSQSTLFVQSINAPPLEELYVTQALNDPCWNSLIWRESGWKWWAKNPISSAYGLGQFLESTWAGTGYEKSDDPEIQLAAMLAYIQNRYGTTCEASRHQVENNWY